MNEKITATLSLTKEKWGLIFLMVKSSAPHLPKDIWDLTWELCDDIEKALADSEEFNPDEIDTDEVKQYFNRLIELDEEGNNESS